MRKAQPISPFKAWLLAARPRTLPASVAPVLVGIAAAIFHDGFKLYPALAALAGALLLQIGVNLANDYFDFVKGIDTSERLGPMRVTQSGLISPERVRRGMLVIFGLAAAVGLYLIWVAGWPILLVGLVSMVSALAYSGGPFPLASHGLGDLFVFVCFGLIAVCGTYYVQALDLTWQVVVLAVVVGFLITAILVVNNLRDIETDKKAGKRTLAVMIGQRGTRIEYSMLLTGSYLILILLWLPGLVSHGFLLPLLSLPMAFSLIRFIDHNSGPALNEALAGTAKLALLFSFLLSLGLIFSP